MRLHLSSKCCMQTLMLILSIYVFIAMLSHINVLSQALKLYFYLPAVMLCFHIFVVLVLNMTSVFIAMLSHINIEPSS